MRYAESTRPCDGKKGQYEVWMYHLPAVGRAVQNIFSFDATSANERALTSDNPDEILGFVESTPHYGRRLRDLDEPTVTAVVRVCQHARHRPEAEGEEVPVTSLGSGRVEIVSRTVWVPQTRPQRIGHVVVDARMQLDDTNIGRARAINKMWTQVWPVVSPPVTRAEAEYARSWGVGRVVVGLPTGPEHGPVFVAVHPQIGEDPIAGEIVERLYTPERAMYRGVV